jgi:hypothetical protein
MEVFMNWEMFAAIAELLSATGVIISLLYVGSQVRQNTKMMHAASIDATIGATNYVREQIVAHADVASLYNRGNRNPDELTDEETVRYRILIQSILWTSWNSYAQTQLTGLDRSVFEAQKPFIKRIVSTPGGKWFWQAYQNEFEANFRETIEEILDNSPAP